MTTTTQTRRRWYVTAQIVAWNHAAGDYDEIDLDHDTRAHDADEAEELAREAWSDHGYNPDRVTVRPID